jgi:uncharacterized protein (DUF736 family)
MAYEQRDNTGVLFPNTKKEKDTHADFTGNGKVNGVDMWVNGWKKKSPKGVSYLSLSFQPKEARAPIPPNSKRKWGEELNDSIDF